MTKDIKLHILAVVLPAVVLAAGGIRLVVLEGSRARTAVQERLDAVSADLARRVVESFKEKGISPRRAKPPQHGERERRIPLRREECREHILPPDLRPAIQDMLTDENVLPEDLCAELRHICGCLVQGGGGKITGRTQGRTSLKPYLPDYFVCVAPRGGDEAVAGSVKTQIFLVSILGLLFMGTFAAGTALLWRSAKAAREEARRKTDFISNVSHELRTPLTSIAIFAEMLAEGGLDANAAARAAATMAKESKRLASMIDSLLAFARLERGTAKFAIENCELKPLLEDAAAAFAPSLPNGISVNAEDICIRTDPAALRRILDNLLENAAKYASSAPVKISAYADGKFAVVDVADEGAGIPATEAKHVFERFWRGDDSVTRTAGGTGLGLAIAHDTALALGGGLSLAANRPHGCIFTLKMPMAGGGDG